MKNWMAIFLFVSIFDACKPASDQPASGGTVIPKDTQQTAVKNFFPVTDFIKGQLVEFDSFGLTPLKFTIIGDRKDSAWLKKGDYVKAFEEYLNPVIDSANLSEYFAEKSFHDQTINAITLSYDPVKPLPDSLAITRWDIYIDPETNKVKKIYLVKKQDAKSIRQLTWQVGKQCRAITAIDAGNGRVQKSNEVIIKWDPE